MVELLNVSVCVMEISDDVSVLCGGVILNVSVCVGDGVLRSCFSLRVVEFFLMYQCV